MHMPSILHNCYYIYIMPSISLYIYIYIIVLLSILITRHVFVVWILCIWYHNVYAYINAYIYIYICIYTLCNHIICTYILCANPKLWQTIQKTKLAQRFFYASVKATWKIDDPTEMALEFQRAGGNFLHLHGMIACNISQNPICSLICSGFYLPLIPNQLKSS